MGDTELPTRRGLDLAVQNPARQAGLQLRRLRPWLEELLAELAPEATSFTLRFVTDGAMRRLNRTWRGKDRATDVLSFPGERHPDGWHLGDVVIAVRTARRQADHLEHSLETELRRLALHGVLHCLGHDHVTDDGAMTRLERRLSRRWVETGA